MHSADNPFSAEEDALETEDSPDVVGTLVDVVVSVEGEIVDGAATSVDWSAWDGTRTDVSTDVSMV
jgi:hypothetical protein